MSIETVNSFEEVELFVMDRLLANNNGYWVMRLKVRAWPIKPLFPAVNGVPVASVLDVKVCHSEWPDSPGSGRWGISVRVKDTWAHLYSSEGKLTQEQVKEALVELFSTNGYKINP